MWITYTLLSGGNTSLRAGPCRKFTPLLSICYEDLADKDELEIVFMSSDSDIDGFNEYYEEMPW